MTKGKYIPQTWAATKVEDVFMFHYGKALPERVRSGNGEVKVYGSSGVIGRHDIALVTKDAIIVGRKGSKGKTHLCKGMSWPIDTTYYVVPPSSIDIEYAYYNLLSLRLDWIDQSTAVPSLPRDEVYRLPITICPPSEQIGIVRKIDQLFFHLEKAEEALERVKRNVGRYRSSVLKAAFEGRLVPTEAELARQEGREYETATELLKHTLQERRKRWEQEELAKMRAKGKEPKNDKWKAKYKAPAEPKTDELPALPGGWCWATLDQLHWLITSGSRGWSKYYADSGADFIRAQDINTDFLRRDGIAKVKLPDGVEGLRTLVANNDLLITITGANVTKAAVAFIDSESYVSQHVALLKHLNSDLSNYVHFYIISPSHGRGILEKIAYGAGKPGLNLDNVRELVVALPPLVELVRITKEIEKKLSVHENILNNLLHKEKQSHRLRQSILKVAFQGRLVPQDPADEPASVLLDRIRAEREAALGAAKKTRPRGRSARKTDKSEAASSREVGAFVAGNALVQARKSVGMTQAELARATGINQAYISQMENGRKGISPDHAAALATTLNIDPRTLTKAE